MTIAKEMNGMELRVFFLMREYVYRHKNKPVCVWWGQGENTREKHRPRSAKRMR
jgi:hypothetical protein